MSSRRMAGVPPRRAVDLERCRAKAKCLNTDLARHLLSKSSRFVITARLGPFPRGLARRRAASYFWRLEFARLKDKHSRSSGPAALLVGTAPTFQRRLPAYEVAKRRRVREETSRCATVHQRPLQLAAIHSNQIRVQALCFGDFHLGQQMFAQRGSAHFAKRSYADTKVTRPPGRDPAPDRVNRPPEAETRHAKDHPNLPCMNHPCSSSAADSGRRAR